MYFLKVQDPYYPLTLWDDKDNDKDTHKYTNLKCLKDRSCFWIKDMYNICVIDYMLPSSKWQGDRWAVTQVAGEDCANGAVVQRCSQFPTATTGGRWDADTIRPQNIQQTHVSLHSVELLIIFGFLFPVASKEWSVVYLFYWVGCTQERRAWKAIINVIETKSAITPSLFTK